MEMYVILRRGAWHDEAEAEQACARAAAETARRSEFVGWLRSYMFSECDGTIGSICIYEAGGPEAIRRHSSGASLPVDEIVLVVDTVVVRPDPAATAA